MPSQRETYVNQVLECLKDIRTGKGYATEAGQVVYWSREPYFIDNTVLGGQGGIGGLPLPYPRLLLVDTVASIEKEPRQARGVTRSITLTVTGELSAITEGADEIGLAYKSALYDLEQDIERAVMSLQPNKEFDLFPETSTFEERGEREKIVVVEYAFDLSYSWCPPAGANRA